MALFAARLGHRVTAIDLSPGTLQRGVERATDLGLTIDFAVGDAEVPEFPDAAFDVVMSRHVLWTLPHSEAAATRRAALVAPGGVVAVFDIYHPRLRLPRRVFGVLAERIDRAGRRQAGGHHYTAQQRAALPLAVPRDTSAGERVLREAGWLTSRWCDCATSTRRSGTFSDRCSAGVDLGGATSRLGAAPLTSTHSPSGRRVGVPPIEAHRSGSPTCRPGCSGSSTGLGGGRVGGQLSLVPPEAYGRQTRIRASDVLRSLVPAGCLPRCLGNGQSVEQMPMRHVAALARRHSSRLADPRVSPAPTLVQPPRVRRPTRRGYLVPGTASDAASPEFILSRGLAAARCAWPPHEPLETHAERLTGRSLDCRHGSADDH